MSKSDPSLFQSVYDQYYSMVANLCRGYMKGDADMADDLVQDVFINVWKALDSYRGDASYKTWIYRIAVNTCLLQIRKDKSKISVPLTERLDRAEDHDTDAHTEREHFLYHAIGQLDAVDRLVITMLLEEVEYDEIARVMGITENNLRVKVHRIKSRIKNIMDNGSTNG